MKKVLLSMLACAALGTAANAQGLLIYGSLGYSTTNNRDIVTLQGTPTTTGRTLNNSLNFSPGIGYMINDMLAVGIELNAIGNKYHYDFDVAGNYDYDVRNFAIGGGPFVRVTKNIGEHFYTFTQATVSYLNGRTKYENSAPGVTYDPVNRYDGINGTLYPSVGIKITPCMSVAASFGGVQYTYRKDRVDPRGFGIVDPNTGVVTGTAPTGNQSDEFTQKYSSFGVNFGQTAFITAQWMLGGHHRTGNAHPGDDTRRMKMDDEDDNDNGGSRRRRSRDMDDE